MEIVTSWGQEAAEKTAETIAMNLLREGLASAAMMQDCGYSSFTLQNSNHLGWKVLILRETSPHFTKM